MKNLIFFVAKALKKCNAFLAGGKMRTPVEKFLFFVCSSTTKVNPWSRGIFTSLSGAQNNKNHNRFYF
jgi:hypothetical protein